MTRWFAKELPTSPIWVMGYPMRFDFLETSDAMVIAELDNAIHNRMGGVSSITQEQYQEEIKKKESAILSGNSSNQKQWRTELAAPFLPAQNVAGSHGSFAKPQQPPAVAPQLLNPQSQEMPDPLTVPKPEALKIPKPPTAKLNKPAP